MKKHLSLLLLPVFCFSQITLDKIFSIQTETDFQRIMIENGFSSNPNKEELWSIDFIYKPTYNYLDELVDYEIMSAFFPANQEDFSNATVVLLFSEDYKNENLTYESLYDKVKNECKFFEIRGGELAVYRCPDKNPSPELLDLNNRFTEIRKILGTEPANGFKGFDLTDKEIGFERSKGNFLIRYSITTSADIEAAMMALFNQLAEGMSEEEFQQEYEFGLKISDSLNLE